MDGPGQDANGVGTESIAAGEWSFTVDVSGPANGDLVLLLHGFPQTRYTWRRELQTLAQAGFRTCAPDQRGYSAGRAPAGYRWLSSGAPGRGRSRDRRRTGRRAVPPGRPRLGRSPGLGDGGVVPGTGALPRCHFASASPRVRCSDAERPGAIVPGRAITGRSCVPRRRTNCSPTMPPVYARCMRTPASRTVMPPPTSRRCVTAKRWMLP